MDVTLMKEMLYKYLEALDLFLSLLAIASFLYFHGFSCTHGYQVSQVVFCRLIFLYFAASYLLRCWSMGDFLNSIYRQKYEAVFFVAFVIDTLSFIV